MSTILLISRNKRNYDKIRAALFNSYQILWKANLEEVLAEPEKTHAEIVFIDIGIFEDEILNEKSIKTSLRSVWQKNHSAQIIVIASASKTRLAVDFVRLGASNYLNEPIDEEEVKLVLDSLYESSLLTEELEHFRDEFWKTPYLKLVMSRSPIMKSVYEKVRAVARTKTTVLLTGETGTGKGVVAQLIHQHSNRSDGSFIAVHCGAISDSLIESELFGHEKGSFTGADRKKLGKFEIADSGTIFLDEIGTITPAAQIKLLQILHERNFQRVGGSHDVQIDVRIIAATNENLKELTEKGKFRKDLYFRLDVFPINLPPLRNRIEDIEHLVEVIIKRLDRVHGKGYLAIHKDVLGAFKAYSWPGNVRELENLLERAYILETTRVMHPDKFPEEIFGLPKTIGYDDADISVFLSNARRIAIERFEKKYIEKLLITAKGKIKTAAEIAGISTRHLHELMDKYDFDKKKFKL